MYFPFNRIDINTEASNIYLLFISQQNTSNMNTLLEEYCLNTTQTEPDLLLELIEKTYSEMGFPEKLSGRIIGRTLKLLISISRPKQALEIGMFTGYSALSIAEALPEDGKLICCETNPKAIDFAQSFFDRSPHGHKISTIFGPALETIKTIEKELDFVFIDADKRNYLNYYEAVIPLVRSGGLIAIDNSIWQGRVLTPNEASDHAVAEMNQRILVDERVENVHLNIRDGLNLVLKK